MDVFSIFLGVFKSLWWVLPILAILGFLKTPKAKGMIGELFVNLSAKSQLTEDIYCPIHTGVLSSGKSQFFNRLNDKQLVLDAAAYANKAGLWVGNKAKIILDRPIGVHAGTGNPTNVLNVYRTNNGIVHGAPGSPL